MVVGEGEVERHGATSEVSNEVTTTAKHAHHGVHRVELGDGVGGVHGVNKGLDAVANGERFDVVFKLCLVVVVVLLEAFEVVGGDGFEGLRQERELGDFFTGRFAERLAGFSAVSEAGGHEVGHRE